MTELKGARALLAERTAALDAARKSAADVHEELHTLRAGSTAEDRYRRKVRSRGPRRRRLSRVCVSLSLSLSLSRSLALALSR